MSDFTTLGIPFFFLLAVAYGSLEFSGMFKNKAVNGMIALAVAAISITNQPTVDFINQYLPFAGGLFALLFFMGFMLKSFGIKKDQKKDWTLISFSLIVLLIVFVREGDRFRDLFANRLPISYDNFLVLIALIALGILFWAAYKRGHEKTPGT